MITKMGGLSKATVRRQSILKRFETREYTGNHCFYCGKKLRSRTDEHVFPLWLQRRFELQNQMIYLLNGTAIKCSQLKVPCCGFDNTEATPFFLATTNSAFSTYALSTPINVSGTAVFSPGNCPTTFGGCVEIDSVTGDATFTATPLPAALPLFATGIGGLGLLGWRRKRKAQAVA